MKKVILNVVAAVLMVLGLNVVATIAPVSAVTCADGSTQTKLEDCSEWSGVGGVADNTDLMSVLTTIINGVVCGCGDDRNGRYQLCYVSG